MFCLQNALVIDLMFLSNTYTIILHSRQSGPHTAKGAARAETGGGGHWWSADQSCPQTRGMMWAKCKICNKTRVRGMCCCCWSDRDWRTILNNIIISFVFIRSSWSLINLTWWELDPVHVLWKQPTPPKSATLRKLEMRYLGIVTVFKLPGDVWTLMIQLTKKSLCFHQQFLSSWKPLFSARRLL